MEILLKLLNYSKPKIRIYIHTQENLIELIKEGAPDGILLEIIENRPQLLIRSDTVNLLLIFFSIYFQY